MATQTTAAFYTEFGGIDKLQVGPLDLPEIGESDVLLRVKAASLNPLDYIVREGYFQQAVPSAFPAVPGTDVAGIVEQVGPGVTRLRVGDEVFGMVYRPTLQHGTCAERLVVPEGYLTRRPQGLSWEAAAGLPLASLTAYQAAIKVGRPQADETVLILGGSGGVGSTAIQLAKHAGATVIAVASAKNAAFMKSLGADFTIDYAAGPVAEAVRQVAPQGVDLLFDAVDGDTLTHSLAALKPTGRLVSVLNEGEELVLPGGVQFTHVYAHLSVPDLEHLRDLAEAGHLQIPIAITLPLADIKQAFRQLESKRTVGKIVIIP
jgi:NADPH:quinone reductase-like Zn-dependent oxidoreductase